jgi:hypothetical protein
MRNIFIVMIYLFACANATSQQTKNKGNFSVMAEAALLNGDGHVNGQVLLNGGYEIKRWFVGFGSGFDYYKYRTVPVFADVRKYFGKQNRALFLYAKAGMNIAMPTENQKNFNDGNWWGLQSNNQFKNGFFGDAGFGYTLFNSKSRGFYTSLGLSTKTLTETYDEQVWNGGSSISTKRTLEYNMNRFGMRIGYKF